MCAKNLIIYLVTVIINFSFFQLTQAIAFDEVSSLHLWITVSSLANKDPISKQLLFRQIELNWINAPLDDHDDYIGLYLDQQPDEIEAQPVSVHKLDGRMHGKLTTNHYLPRIDFMNETRFDGSQWSPEDQEVSYDIESAAYPGTGSARNGDLNADNWHLYNTYTARTSQNRRHRKSISRQATLVSDECIGYCIAYHSQSRILATNCLKTSPNWMKESHSTSRSLPTLMIPGTHNSATYPRQLDKTALQIINKYQINQEESIFNQLVYGIRYLDLRVGHSKVKQRPEELWIYHDIFRTDVSLDEVFEQVARFLELTSHEIIVMDFHRFTVGFQNENTQTQRERHAKLVDLLFKQLGQYIIPSYLGQHAPLNEYISMGKRLVVGYASRSQLLGTLADNHSSMFGLYSAQASKKNQQVRDIDADEQNLELNSADFGQPADLQPDGRMGTRIYNKLKSLKLISRQFSKRSIGSEKLAPPATPNQHLSPMSSRQKTTIQQQFEWETTGEASEMPSSRLVQGEESAARSIEDAVSSLPSRLAILFPPVRHLWPNKDTIDGLAQYMNDTTCRKYFGELRSMMVELTPTVFGAISDKYDGNRRLADLANRPVTDWIRQRWLHCINIVASDFFLGNDLISLSIYANRMRLSNNNRRGSTNDLTSNGGHCRSFRRIEHLLDKSRIAASSQNQPASTNTHQSVSPDGISELYSFFKRIFNL